MKHFPALAAMLIASHAMAAEPIFSNPMDVAYFAETLGRDPDGSATHQELYSGYLACWAHVVRGTKPPGTKGRSPMAWEPSMEASCSKIEAELITRRNAAAADLRSRGRGELERRVVTGSPPQDMAADRNAAAAAARMLP